MKPETFVIMFSGGFDSTYALWHCLTKTNNPIHAHHVVIKNDASPRWEEEKEACKKIVEYCKKNFRDFEYSESLFEFSGFRNVSWDADIALVVVIMVARNILGFKRIVSGPTKSDFNPHLPRFKALIYPIDYIYDTPLHPSEDKTKGDMYKEMPKELSKLTWSCRQPNDGKPCGICRSCRLRIEEGVPL